MAEANPENVRDYLLNLQDRISTEIEQADGQSRFREDRWDRPEAEAVAVLVFLKMERFLKKPESTFPTYREPAFLRRPQHPVRNLPVLPSVPWVFPLSFIRATRTCPPPI